MVKEKFINSFGIEMDREVEKDVGPGKKYSSLADKVDKQFLNPEPKLTISVKDFETIKDGLEISNWYIDDPEFLFEDVQELMKEGDLGYAGSKLLDAQILIDARNTITRIEKERKEKDVGKKKEEKDDGGADSL